MLKFKLILITLLVGFGFYESKSQNLISNPSFELLNMPINWNFWGGGFFDYNTVPEQPIVTNWMIYNSPDYFTIDYPYPNHARWVPINDFGNSYSKNGNAYGGIIAYTKAGEYKEYISQQLTTPLKQDSIYCLSFFVSRADAVPYAIKNIGAYLSVNTPTVFSNSYIIGVPQVESFTYVTDTIGWTEIKGCFTAQGGEQYVAIGNFNSNANTDTLFVGSINPNPGANGYAYYYVDSVSLWKNNFPTFIKENSKDEFIRVFPNPSTQIINVEIHQQMLNQVQHDYIIKLTDVLGRETFISEYKEEIDISHLENGIYFVAIVQDGKTLGVKKIIKQ